MFITDDFLLTNDLSRKLYHETAAELPIFDYHCHLDPQLIAENYRFLNIVDLWLSGDHYKWRAMRANGVPERLITGDAAPLEKFQAWAETIENAIGNPLYHWVHLELKRYFGITELLTAENAAMIYEQCNVYLKNNQVTTQSLISDSNVAYVGTTDDLLSSLEDHQQIKVSDFPVEVAPSFRPDSALNLHLGFADFIARANQLATTDLLDYFKFKRFLFERISYFNQRGCFVADHGLGKVMYQPVADEEMAALYQKGLAGDSIDEQELGRWQGQLLHEMAVQYHDYDWVMQIHFGVLRNTNTRLLQSIGTDVGTDTIRDQDNIALELNRFLDSLDVKNKLPKTILYNLNPMIHDVVACTVANFQGNEEGIKSKIQFGAGWWFNDTEKGMRLQIETLANQGLLMHFVGMLTDSRSFISYTRHDYFRRILCEYISEEVAKNHYPDELPLLQKLVKNCCYDNAISYFKK
ncbi:glucuronate isomerase [Carnobacterium gallinarum]|uniref:glucuronate isomerase n=1 Tax=Carnobacterium gallinarum TaxID=2749 RepID=UPI00054F3DF1|nr:glucuronate isomerase [Carnobacterium gallinarum]